MLPETWERLFEVRNTFEHPVVRFLALGLVGLMVISPVIIQVLTAIGKADAKLRKDLWDRYWSWLVFIPLMFGPVVLGAIWVIAGTVLLALACYREFARATGIFRERTMSALVVVGILACGAAVADHWYGFFVAIPPLMLGIMAAAAILADMPRGYIQRLALAVFAFLLFGVCFGYLGYFANDVNYRAIIWWLISAVGLNDIFAYITGKSFGRRKLAPNTSPNKTVAGSLGALVLTTTFAAVLGHWVFRGTKMDMPVHLITVGLIISVAGQFGDLTLSSIKRDLGIKDWANTFPGHGGFLDRFNSLIFAAPAAFHYLSFILGGIGLPEEKRIFF